MRRLLWSLLATDLVLSGCRPLEDRFASNRLPPIVDSMRSNDDPIPAEALEALREIRESLTPREGRYVLEEAGAGFRDSTNRGMKAEEELVEAASWSPHVSCAAIVRRDFSVYSPKAQGAALRLLGSLDEREGAEAFVSVLAQVSEEADVTTFGSMEESPRHEEVLFPEVLRHLGHPRLQWPLLKLALAHLSRGPDVAPSTKVELSRSLTEMHDGLRAKLVPLQQSEGITWTWEDDYQELRDVAAIVLDALGRTGTPQSKGELREALEYHDPRLQLFAVLGLLRQGEEPPLDVVFAVAGSAESRNWLHRGLVELEREDLFPESFATQEAFAESEMIGWLIYPTELGRPPDEIELMAVMPEGPDGEGGDLFLFRFRTFPPHWASENGWMAGVAGPFPRGGSPSTEANGGTFSTFGRWDEKSSEEHVRDIQDLLAESWKLRAEEEKR
jgi:hypothetical protein